MTIALKVYYKRTYIKLYYILKESYYKFIKENKNKWKNDLQFKETVQLITWTYKSY